MYPVTRTHIITLMTIAFLVTVGISAFLASLTHKAQVQYGASASLIDGIMGRDAVGVIPQRPQVYCGNETYGLCPRENACILNPVGDYYCVKLSRTVCPAGAECTPCAQTQLEQCIKNNPRTSSCIVARHTGQTSTICSYE